VIEFRADTKTRRGTGFGQGEQELAGALREINTLEIVTHYSSTLAAVTANDRLVNVRTGKVLNIKHVDDPDRRRETIYITAEEGRPNG
jgi:SPP1 family predicted phage head-tail adaptor